MIPRYPSEAVITPAYVASDMPPLGDTFTSIPVFPPDAGPCVPAETRSCPQGHSILSDLDTTICGGREETRAVVLSLCERCRKPWFSRCDFRTIQLECSSAGLRTAQIGSPPLSARNKAKYFRSKGIYYYV